MEKIYSQIIKEIIRSKPESETELFEIVRKITAKMKITPPPKAILLKAYHKLLKNGKITSNTKLEQLLTKRAVRTMSGVAVISVLTKPTPCPGQCLFCPTEKDMPKSYLSNEPAVMRAILNDFDPFRQVKMRLEALRANGHSTDKIELIIMGGTWSCHASRYQSWFIKRCFEALNGKHSKDLISAQKKNETAKHRCIGLTLETRPDYITEKEIRKMRNFGCTRVELGIQHTDDKILKMNRRGHGTKESIKAIRLLKEAGFKINLHFMPNLYGSTPNKDLAMFKRIFTDGDYMPDMIKIYPCVVNEYADLYKYYKQKKYRPYSQKQLIGLIVKIKKITPPWVRITRLIRDIPEESIVAGNKTSNLRQLIANQAEKDGWSCKCIRCREAGHQNQIRITNLPRRQAGYELRIINYRASSGTEYFLSFESPDKKILYAFLRLRINPALTLPFVRGGKHSRKSSLLTKEGVRGRLNSNFLAELKDCAIIRELHTYGLATDIGMKGKVQHTGLGQKLLKEAEKIAKKRGLNKIAVISGIGAREYYRKNGYNLEGTYMVKNI